MRPTNLVLLIAAFFIMPKAAIALGFVAGMRLLSSRRVRAWERLIVRRMSVGMAPGRAWAKGGNPQVFPVKRTIPLGLNAEGVGEWS